MVKRQVTKTLLQKLSCSMRRAFGSRRHTLAFSSARSLFPSWRAHSQVARSRSHTERSAQAVFSKKTFLLLLVMLACAHPEQNANQVQVDAGPLDEKRAIDIDGDASETQT